MLERTGKGTGCVSSGLLTLEQIFWKVCDVEGALKRVLFEEGQSTKRVSDGPMVVLVEMLGGEAVVGGMIAAEVVGAGEELDDWVVVADVLEIDDVLEAEVVPGAEVVLEVDLKLAIY
jgi:hypothetical protein